MRVNNPLCRYHLTGVPLNAPPFYSHTCTRCRAKLAAGLVTEADPPPPNQSRENNARMTRVIFAAARHRRKNPHAVWGE